MGQDGDGDDEVLHSLSVFPCLLLEFKPHPLKEQFLFLSTFHPISDLFDSIFLSLLILPSSRFFNTVFFSHFIVIVWTREMDFLYYYYFICSDNLHVLKHQSTLKAIPL